MSDRADRVNPGLYQKAQSDKNYLEECIRGVSPDRKTMEQRETYSPLLIELSEKKPEMLYPYWNFFAGYLSGENGFSQYVAVYVIANLAAVDREKKMDGTIEIYCGLLRDKAVMVASHAALNLLKIIKARPDLEPVITKHLLGTDSPDFLHKQKELIKANVIETFGGYFRDSRLEEEIVRFVKKQMKSSSPKTAKAAKKFITENALE